MSNVTVHNVNPNVSEMDIVDSLAEKKAIHSRVHNLSGGDTVYQYMISCTETSEIGIFIMYDENGSILEADFSEEFDSGNSRTIEYLDFFGVIGKIINY